MTKRTDCFQCPRRCGGGVCHAPRELVIARTGLHYGEEPCISGTRGSGTVFFAGCNLSCCFCQNYDVSRARIGRTFTPRALADTFRRLEDAGAHNINLVTPSHYVDALLDTFALYVPHIPVVYNTSGYDTVDAINALSPYVSVWLTDLKYCDPAVSGAYSNAPDYFTVAYAALKTMRAHTPVDAYDEDGIMQSGVICRHLVLPSHTADSLAVLDAIAQVRPHPVLALMSQYTPYGDCDRFRELTRRVTTFEYNKVLTHADALGLEGYAQERTSATADEIPRWGEFI